MSKDISAMYLIAALAALGEHPKASRKRAAYDTEAAKADRKAYEELRDKRIAVRDRLRAVSRKPRMK